MMKDLILGIAMYLLSFLLIALYSFIIYIIAHNFFHDKATGSLIAYHDNKIRGSYLLSQDFTSINNSDKYFISRPGQELSGNCDIALYNKVLKDMIVAGYRRSKQAIDITDFTYSNSLLDPYITKRSAIMQAEKVALARNINVQELLELIDKNTLYSSFPFFTLDIVNVTKLNAYLDFNFIAK